MWQFGPNFLFKKYHFAPPPTPIGEGLELGISFWHTYNPIVKFLLLLLLLLLVWWEPTCSLHPKVGFFQEIFYAAKVTMIPRRGVLCLPLALMEMETSHFRDKYKSWSSCIEREFIFPLWVVLLFFKPIEAINILWQIMKGCRFPYLPLQWN
jgi:hypothetical protein